MDWRKLISDAVSGDHYDMNACTALCDAVGMHDEWMNVDESSIVSVIKHAVGITARMMYEEAFERSECNA